jgi:hypothetical protein
MRVIRSALSVTKAYFARPIAIRVTRKGLEAGLEQFGDAAAAGI